MTPPRRTARASRAGRALNLIAGLAISAALILAPPALPDFGPSLTTPLTTSTLAQLALLAAWIVLLLLALALLQRALTPTRALLPPPWALGTPRRPRSRLPPAPRRAPSAPRLLLPPRAPCADEASDTDEPTAAGPALAEPVATISLLGPVAIDGVKRPRRASTVELLAYLALRPDGATRDELLEALWPVEDPRRTRPRLWQSVSEARRLLGDAFERHSDRYKLDRTRVEIDTITLEHLLIRLDASPPTGEAEAIVRHALALWRGHPLSGTDYAWADTHVRQLEATLSKLADTAARARLAAGDAHGALQVAEQGLASDDLNETFVRIALEAEAALGRREAVTERYEALRKRLDDRLGLEPERATRALYRELLGQE